MDTKIDYFSFTQPLTPDRVGGYKSDEDRAIETLRHHSPIFVERFAESLSWQQGAGRGHYAHSIFNRDTYTTVRFGGIANHVLVEMPGTSCAAARSLSALDAIIKENAARSTRLDIACDITPGMQPREFVAAGHNARFKAGAVIYSAEGDTVYVGSMKSDRYARVYMYHEPHPRAGIMRVEHVLRADYAKKAAATLADISPAELATMCGNTWGWKHAAWQPAAATDAKLKTTRAERHEPARLRWLYEVVQPAIAKAAADGLIDPDEFLAGLTAIIASYQPAPK